MGLAHQLLLFADTKARAFSGNTDMNMSYCHECAVFVAGRNRMRHGAYLENIFMHKSLNHREHQNQNVNV